MVSGVKGWFCGMNGTVEFRGQWLIFLWLWGWESQVCFLGGTNSLISGERLDGRGISRLSSTSRCLKRGY